MADTYTTNLELRKPQVGGATNEWGGRLNNDLDIIDGILLLMAEELALV